MKYAPARTVTFLARVRRKIDMKSKHTIFLICATLLQMGICRSQGAQPPQADVDFFEQKIRPVLVEKCHKCHSAQAPKLKGGLSVESREALLKGGETGPAIVPLKPGQSLLIKAIGHGDEETAMPPKEKLPANVLADFEKWVQLGAPFPAARPNVAKETSPAWWEKVAEKDLLPQDRSIAQAVDHYLNDRLAKAKVKPAGAVADVAWIRRAMLDLAGRIPTVDEVKAYVVSRDPKKKEKLVDALIASPGFVRHQSTEMAWLLMDGSGKGTAKSSGKKGGQAGANFDEYVTRTVATNRRWDQVFKDIILADDATDEANGASGFLRDKIKDQDRLVTDVSSRFFGVNISCAQCHDHPLVPTWKQDHYYGMKSFFSRTFENGDFLGERDYGTISFKPNKGESRQVRPMFLGGAPITEPKAIEPNEEQKKAEKKLLDEAKTKKEPLAPPAFSRRAKLIEEGLKAGQEGFFSRSIANQLWNRFFGRGLVMPLDQMHGQNSPSHPELLEWLARDLTKNNYDLRRLIRGLALSDAYARSSRWEHSARPEPALFAAAIPRALTPAQFGVSLHFAAADPEMFKPTLTAEERLKTIERLEKTGQGMSSLFERPGDDFHVGVDEALLFSNGDRIQRELLADGGGRLIKHLAASKDRHAQVEAVVWNILSRPAEPAEIKLFGDYLEKRQDRAVEALQQIAWSLISCAEFRFNH